MVPEEDIFRIDHFLGVATVFNLVGLRFANRMLAPIWSAEHIERVEIVYDEDLALEGRAGYYDGAGALKDMLQSHLLQVLALFAMESIAALDARELQDQKAQVLRATKVWGGSPKRRRAGRATPRGRSAAGQVPDYAKEEGVDPKRSTETLAQVTLEVANTRWAGVPFVLRSGKAMGVPRKQIVAHFRDVPHLPTGFVGGSDGDLLTIDLKPGAVSLTLTMNAEGDPVDLEQKTLPPRLAAPRMQPYGEVLAADPRRQPAAHRPRRRGRGVLARDGARHQGVGRRQGAAGDVCRGVQRSRGLARAVAAGIDGPPQRVPGGPLRRGRGPSRARGRRSGRGRGAGSRRRTSRPCPSCGRWCG